MVHAVLSKFSSSLLLSGWIPPRTYASQRPRLRDLRLIGRQYRTARTNVIVRDIASDRRVRMSDIPSWHITGDWFDNCSCAVACPCTFAQAPDNGFCESVLFWHIRQGHYGDISLDDLSFVRVGRWEGDLWAGKAKGAAGIFIDDRADERQAEVLPRIFGGQVGGFPALVAGMFTEGRQIRGIERARISFEIAP